MTDGMVITDQWCYFIWWIVCATTRQVGYLSVYCYHYPISPAWALCWRSPSPIIAVICQSPNKQMMRISEDGCWYHSLGLSSTGWLLCLADWHHRIPPCLLILSMWGMTKSVAEPRRSTRIPSINESVTPPHSIESDYPSQMATGMTGR